MRTHGWSGATPVDDEEAVDRILTAARAAIDRSGNEFTIAEIARDFVVTRQTVYRYFPSAEALLTATAVAQTRTFLDVLAEHLSDIRDPATAVVEGIAYTLERLPHEKYLKPAARPRSRQRLLSRCNLRYRTHVRPLDPATLLGRLARGRNHRP